MLRLRRTPEQSSPVIESGLSVVWKGTINSTETGKVNVSEATSILAAGKFNFIPRGKVEAKNKGLIEMFFVERF